GAAWPGADPAPAEPGYPLLDIPWFPLCRRPAGQSLVGCSQDTATRRRLRSDRRLSREDLDVEQRHGGEDVGRSDGEPTLEAPPARLQRRVRRHEQPGLEGTASGIDAQLSVTVAEPFPGPPLPGLADG